MSTPAQSLCPECGKPWPKGSGLMRLCTACWNRIFDGEEEAPNTRPAQAQDAMIEATDPDAIEFVCHGTHGLNRSVDVGESGGLVATFHGDRADRLAALFVERVLLDRALSASKTTNP